MRATLGPLFLNATRNSLCIAQPLILMAGHEALVILWDVGASMAARTDAAAEEAKKVWCPQCPVFGKAREWPIEKERFRLVFFISIPGKRYQPRQYISRIPLKPRG